MATPPKGHHTVAQMHLRRFSENGRVRLVARDNFAVTHTCSISAALKINNFYTIDFGDGSCSTEIENPGFSNLEGAATAVIRKIIGGVFPPSSSERKALSLFLAYQLVRGEGTRAAIVEQRTATAAKVAELTLELARQATMNAGAADGPVGELLRSVKELFVKEHGRAPTPVEVRAELRAMARLKGHWTIDNPASAHVVAFENADDVA